MLKSASCTVMLLASIGSSALADTSGLIPPGYCAIVVASETHPMALRRNAVIQALGDSPYWVFSTQKGAVAAVIGASPLEGREAIIGELLEGGMVDTDAFCMSPEKLVGLATEPPSVEFPIFGGPMNESTEATEVAELAHDEKELPRSTPREPIAAPPPQKETSPSDVHEDVLRPVDPNRPVRVTLEDASLGRHRCIAELGTYQRGQDRFDVTINYIDTGWSFSFKGDKNIAPDFPFGAVGGTATNPIISNFEYRQDGDKYDTTMVNGQEQLFRWYFLKTGEWRDWPRDIVPLSTKGGLNIVLSDKRLPGVFDNIELCINDIDAIGIEVRKNYCREMLKWTDINDPPAAECRGYTDL